MSILFYIGTLVALFLGIRAFVTQRNEHWAVAGILWLVAAMVNYKAYLNIP